VFAYKIVERLIRIGEFLIAANLLAWISSVMVKRLRPLSTGLLLVSTWYWAVTLTVWCAIIVYSGWGWFLTLLGLFAGIVGIIPVAFLCLLLSRHWFDLSDLLFQISLVALGAFISYRRIQRKVDI
jgi:hypothetical protein